MDYLDQSGTSLMHVIREDSEKDLDRLNNSTVVDYEVAAALANFDAMLGHTLSNSESEESEDELSANFDDETNHNSFSTTIQHTESDLSDSRAEVLSKNSPALRLRFEGSIASGSRTRMLSRVMPGMSEIADLFSDDDDEYSTSTSKRDLDEIDRAMLMIEHALTDSQKRIQPNSSFSSHGPDTRSSIVMKQESKGTEEKRMSKPIFLRKFSLPKTNLPIKEEKKKATSRYVIFISLSLVGVIGLIVTGIVIYFVTRSIHVMGLVDSENKTLSQL